MPNCYAKWLAFTDNIINQIGSALSPTETGKDSSVALELPSNQKLRKFADCGIRPAGRLAGKKSRVKH